MDKRPVSKDFVAAMEEGLQHGREMGRTWWDSFWKDRDSGLAIPDMAYDLFDLLQEEVEEFGDVISPWGALNLQEVRKEAADIANFAMMIADLAGALGERERNDARKT